MQSEEPIEETGDPELQERDREATRPTPRHEETGEETTETGEGARQDDRPSVELAVDTEDDLPKEGERVDGVQVGPLVANAFNQLRKVAER